MKKILFINGAPREFRIAFFNELYKSAKKNGFDIDFKFIHVNNFNKDKKTIKFPYETIKDSKIFNSQNAHLHVNFRFLDYIDKKYDIIVLPVPDHPLSFLEFLKSYKKAKKQGCKTILWWNPPRWKSTKIKVMYWKIRRIFLSPVIKNLDAIITYCNYGKETYSKEYGVEKKHIFVAQNSMGNKNIIKKSENFLKTRKTEKLKNELNLKKNKIILFIGKIVSGKGLENLILSIKEMKNENIKMVVIGEGESLEQMKQLVANMGIKKEIIFVGKKTSDAENYINLADVVVLPGLGGLAVNHAMLCKKPVITSAADGTPLDLIKDGREGFILKKGPPHEISKRIKDVLRINKKNIMGKMAFNTIRKKASPEKMAKEFINAFNFALK